MEWLKNKVRKHFWDTFLKGTLFGWLTYVVASLYIGTLSLTTMSFVAVVSFVFLNGWFYAVIIFWGAYGLIKLIRFLIHKIRRWSAERDERLTTMIADKVKSG